MALEGITRVDIDWDGDYDWASALDEASGTGYRSRFLYDTEEELQAIRALTSKDIAETLLASEGENDGPSWLAVVRMVDGRFALIHAGCDYTGWDCRAWGEIEYADTFEELCRMHMDDDQRHRLGVDVFGGRVQCGS